MNRKILLVDDDPAILKFLKPMFLKNNYDPVFAEDGVEAIIKIKESIPDLVVSDIMMPRMTGLELYRYLQGDARTAEIPFIFLSAKDDPSDQLKGLRIGAEEYLTKPFDLKNLFGTIKKVLTNADKAKTLSDRIDFSGNLGELNLEDMVQIIDVNQKTGELVFTTLAYERIGTVFFKDGVLINAATETLRGEEAFVELSNHTNGYVVFYSRPIDIPKEIAKETMSVLFEAARLRDEAKTLYRLIDGDTEKLRLISKKIDPEIIDNIGIDRLTNVIQLIEQKKTVQYIVRNVKMSRPRVETILAELLNAEIVTTTK